MFTNPALRHVTVREYDLLDAPTAITASTVPSPGHALTSPV